MKKIVLLLFTLLLLSCVNKEKIEKEKSELEKENLFILDEQNRLFKSTNYLIDVKKNLKITSTDSLDINIIRVEDEIKFNNKRRDSLTIVLNNNLDKISTLINQLE